MTAIQKSGQCLTEHFSYIKDAYCRLLETSSCCPANTYKPGLLITK